MSVVTFEHLRAEATNPETSPERLAKLAKNERIAPFVAANPNTSVETLLALAQAHPQEFLDNPILPLLHLEDPRQLTQIERLGALAVLRFGNVPRWLSDAWCQHADETVRVAARLHVGQIDDPLSGSDLADVEIALRQTDFEVQKGETFNFSPLRLPEWIVQCLCQHSNAEVRASIIGSDISSAILAQFAEQPYFRRVVAGNANTPPDVLGQLSHDKDARVREAVAGNPHTTGDILKNLARNQASEVRAAVAANANTPVDVLTPLASDNDPYVREGVASNPNTPESLLTTLRHDQQWKVRIAVARNPNTPAWVLRRLVHDQDRGVGSSAQSAYNEQPWKKPRRATPRLTARQRIQEIADALAQPYTRQSCLLKCLIMLTYPDLPAYVLVDRMDSLFWPERYVIARHPNADLATLKQLAQDGNRFVRAAARERLTAGDGKEASG